MVIIDRKISSVYIAVVMSAILYALGFTSFLLVMPMLIYYSRSREREKTLLSLAVLLVFVLMMEIFPLIGTLSDKGNLGILSIGLFLPVVLIGSSMVWVLLDGYRLLTRYVASSAIVALIMVIIGFWFKSDAEMSLAVDNAIVSAMNSILGQDSQQTSYILGISSQEFFITMRTVVFSMLLPLGAGCFGFNAFFALSTPKYVGDEEFDERVKNWKLPEGFMWAFLVSLIILLLGVVIDYSLSISVIVLNLVLYLAMLFAIQALSIILYRRRAKGNHTRAARVFGLTLFLILLFQGLNIVAVIGLPIFGVTETWFTYRK
ncbi:MAG: DUF2232 domain-containing protein [Sphaerochaetaceae bacterium]|nr:DUF2232 domain-containing protein [Sphaerochaetaceae bacterium]